MLRSYFYDELPNVTLSEGALNAHCTSEAMLTLRGHHSTEVLQSFRKDGQVCIQVPHSNDILHVVSQYKHLGCVTCSRRSNIPYAKARASIGMAAYSPLAVKLFGCPVLQLHLRINFMKSLVLSTTLFNAHVRVLDGRALNILNAFTCVCFGV